MPPWWLAGEGPPRWILTITQGVSVIAANPMFSIIREKPGPLVAVIARAPVHEAPITEAMLAISSSIWMKTPFFFGSFTAMCSAISVEGVIGYPPKNLQPAASAPSAQAVFPCQNSVSRQYSIATFWGSYGSSSIQWIAWSGQVSWQTPQSVPPVEVPEPAVGAALGTVQFGDDDTLAVGLLPLFEDLIRADFCTEIAALAPGLVNGEFHGDESCRSMYSLSCKKTYCVVSLGLFWIFTREYSLNASAA